MHQIAIYGNNKISSFIQSALADRGIKAIDITDNLNVSESDAKESFDCVLDVSNAEHTWSEDDAIIHNTTEIKDILDLSKKLNAPYLFIYRELEDMDPGSPLLIALDFIPAYAKRANAKFAKIQIEDIYGPDINTSAKLESFIQSIIEGESIVVDTDQNEHYLLNQNDFTEGLIQIIEESKKPNSSSSYTLYPED